MKKPGHRSGTKKRIGEKHKAGEKIQSLQDLKNDNKVNKSELKDYEDKIRELIDIDNPSRELIQALIDKIIIDKDRNIEIIYKFSMLNA